MEKITADSQEAKSADIVAENITRLKELFPEAFAEGGIDFEVLKQLLGGAVNEKEEKYNFTWPGKRQARQIALTPSLGTLRPAPGESVDWGSTKNIFIEGDNLEVLKLLQKSYSGKVKMIYIDPPYNTGKDFVYPDDYRDNIKNYKAFTKHVDEEGNSLTSNKDMSGRYHSNWLSMIYPRLELSKKLLRRDGAIFISIDDCEIANLRKVCDEIFGEENFVASIIWQKKYAVSNDDPGIAAMHDYIVVYSKSEEFERNLLPRTEKQLDRYTNIDNDPRGNWSSDNYVSNKSKEERPTLWYPIRHPKTGEDVWPEPHAVWRYSREKHSKMENENRLYWGPDLSYNRPRLKRFLSEVQDGVVPSTWWPFSDVGHNDEAQKEVGSILGRKEFDTPKPLRLLKQLMVIGASSNDIILDFFAGSGTTAHAVLELNKQDNGNRRFIMMQLPEPTGSKQYSTIAEMGKERIRRAIQKIKAGHLGYTGDLGFRVFKLDGSNIRPWNPDANDVAGSLLAYTDNLLPDRTEQDLLYEVLLKFGLELTSPMQEKIFAGHTAYSMGQGVLFACLSKSITPTDIEPIGLGIATWRKETNPVGESTVIFRDNAFANDVAKANMTAILQQHGIDNVRSL